MFLLNNYNSLLTFTIFLGSIVLFSNYLDRVQEKYDGKTAPISRKLSKLIIFLNYVAVTIIWVSIIILLMYYCEDNSFAFLYNCIVIVSIFASTIVLLTLLMTWLEPWINKITIKIKNKKYLNNSYADIKNYVGDD